MIALSRKPKYRIRNAGTLEDVKACQRLRYDVFNTELGEGLITSHKDRLDVDPYDVHCDHLIVESTESSDVIGTYRLQTGNMAANAIGYYSAQEFNFAPYEPYRAEILELGRACIHKDHRKRAVLELLWQGIAEYALETKIRYLIGCSSLTSQNPQEGWATYNRIAPTYLASEAFQTLPLENFELPPNENKRAKADVPKLFATYLHLGAKVAGPPAIDRDFKTIDFLTILDIEAISSKGKNHFFKSRA